MDFRLRFTDTLRLATRIHRREPVYLAQNTDQRQALEEFMQEWFLVKPRPPEYLIHVIIGRRKYTSPAPEELITGMDRQIQRETEEFTGDQRALDSAFRVNTVQSLYILLYLPLFYG